MVALNNLHALVPFALSCSAMNFDPNVVCTVTLPALVGKVEQSSIHLHEEQGLSDRIHLRHKHTLSTWLPDQDIDAVDSYREFELIHARPMTPLQRSHITRSPSSHR